MNQLNFFDPKEPVGFLGGNLPHWRQDGVTYFVTFRLGDSMPQRKLWQWRRERDEWMKQHPLPYSKEESAEYYRRFVTRFERWLDAGYGSCAMATESCRQIVERALRWFDGIHYHLGQFVVMPNHVHAVVVPYGPHKLSSVVQSWKRNSARAINERVGRVGCYWQKEYFDHIVRSIHELDRINAYIKRNPERAGLK